MNNRRSFIVGIKSTKLSSKEKNFIKRYKTMGYNFIYKEYKKYPTNSEINLRN